MDFLLNLPPRVFARIAGFRNLFSNTIWPIPDYETEDTPSLQDGWTIEDAHRIHDLCVLLSGFDNERDRNIALNAIFIANNRFYDVLKDEFGEIW